MATFIKKVFGKSKSQIQRDEARYRSANLLKLASLLQDYSATFTIDLDELWLAHDTDRNGYLDLEECRAFINELVEYIDYDRAQNYDPAKFDLLFETYDED